MFRTIFDTPQNATPPTLQDDLAIDPFEEWVGATIPAIADLLDGLRAEITSLRKRVVQLEQGAGRGLIHPSGLLRDFD
jgi:hypothetical protein